MSPEKAELIHTLTKQILDPASRELSLDELQAVAGGATDRNWDEEGCAATVETGSSCWFMDGGCVAVNINYNHTPSPIAGSCPNCRKVGLIYEDSVLIEKIDSYRYLYQDNFHCHYCGHKCSIEIPKDIFFKIKVDFYRRRKLR